MAYGRVMGEVIYFKKKGWVMGGVRGERKIKGGIEGDKRRREGFEVETGREMVWRRREGIKGLAKERRNGEGREKRRPGCYTKQPTSQIQGERLVSLHSFEESVIPPLHLLSVLTLTKQLTALLHPKQQVKKIT